jgi:hypothetical protein
MRPRGSEQYELSKYRERIPFLSPQQSIGCTGSSFKNEKGDEAGPQFLAAGTFKTLNNS